MSSFARLVRAQPARAVAGRTVAARPFSQAATLRLREDRPNDPATIEKAKQEQLKDGKKKAPLESQSEANVAADQEKVADHDQHIEKLQKETAQQQKKEQQK